MFSAILLVLITIFRMYTVRQRVQYSPTDMFVPVPPVGVAIIAGCGADLLINICLTLLGYIPGHIHAYVLDADLALEVQSRAAHLSLARQSADTMRAASTSSTPTTERRRRRVKVYTIADLRRECIATMSILVGKAMEPCPESDKRVSGRVGDGICGV